MSTVAVAPSTFKKFQVQIATDDYAPAVASCKFTPNQTTSTWKGGTPDAVFTDVSTPTWTCAMKIAQDWKTPGSLSAYFLAHAGEEVAATFVPVEGGMSVAATLVLAPPEVGGDIDAWGETTVTHACKGAPTFTPAHVTALG